MASYPEPPAVGDEVETLLGSWERQRATFAYKCGALTDEQVRRTLGPSQVTIAGLLKHLAYMEDLNFTRDLAGSPLPSPWAEIEAENRGEHVWRSAVDDDARYLQALWGGAAPGRGHAGHVDDDARYLQALWEQAVARSRMATVAAVRAAGVGFTFNIRPGVVCSLRRLLVDFVEEYARHTGHADLLRESIDGRVGEDPRGDRYDYALP